VQYDIAIEGLYICDLKKWIVQWFYLWNWAAAYKS